MDGPPDHDLMARAAQGDERAFRILARRHSAGALRLARRILGAKALAEEIVQDAFLRVWINAPRWRPEAAFRTWLYRVVVNLCLNAKRRPPDVPLAAAGDPADPAPDAGTHWNCASATGSLPPRSIDCPRASAPRSYSPIRKGSATPKPPVLGMSVSGIETLLVRAKQSLREAFGELGEVHEGRS